jgi:Flp pilus assembly protein TadG
MHKLMRRAHDDEQGQMAILMVLIVIVVFMFFALALDAGLWYFDHRTAQNQVDAAALAGALELPDMDEADTEARTWLSRNGSGEVEIDAACWDVGTDANGIEYVQTCVRRDSPGLFSKLAGIQFVTVSAKARAASLPQPALYSLFALNPEECQSLHFQGSAIVEITGGGGTYTRSDCVPDALYLGGGPDVSSGMNHVVGEQGVSGAASTLEPPADEGVGYLQDPLAHVEVPSRPVPICNVPAQGDVTLNPCRFTAFERLNRDREVVLQPGTYFVERGMDIQNGTFRSNGEVLIYVTCPNGACNGAAATPFEVTGGQIDLTGDSTRENILIWVDRTSSKSNSDAVRLGGNGIIDITGVIYAASTDVTIIGTFTSTGGSAVVNAAIVADTIYVQGNSTIDFTFNFETESAIRRLALVE